MPACVHSCDWFDQATGLCGGIAVVSGLRSIATSLAKFGIFPSCMNFVRSCGYAINAEDDQLALALELATRALAGRKNRDCANYRHEANPDGFLQQLSPFMSSPRESLLGRRIHPIHRRGPELWVEDDCLLLRRTRQAIGLRPRLLLRLHALSRWHVVLRMGTPSIHLSNHPTICSSRSMRCQRLPERDSSCVSRGNIDHCCRPLSELQCAEKLLAAPRFGRSPRVRYPSTNIIGV